jgi:hypothetical protein
MRFLLVFCTVGLFAAQAIAAADTSEPRFESYAVSAEAAATNAPVHIVGKRSREYATELRTAAKRPPNFAGHYILASWGCGASCVMSAAIDTKTGVVVWLPFTVCCFPPEVSEPLEFKLDSRLLIVRGSRNEKGAGTYYYLLDPQRFILLKAEEKQAE